MPTLHIQLLGDFRLAYGDTPLTSIESARLQSLLAYLVLHRRAPQPRHHLAFLLWPDSSEAQARTNLRYLLHQLRRALPDVDMFLCAKGMTLQWRTDAPFTLDATDLEGAMAQADQAEQTGKQVEMQMALEKAVALYQDDLLLSCYDDWILPERERLRQLFIEALERLILLLENKRDYSKAIRYAQRLLQHDPLHEATYRHLMRLHALSGDRAGAVRVYHTCETILERELAVGPSPATREVYERLLNMEALPPSAAMPSAVLAAASPLVGRNEEWARLLAAWRTAAAGRSHFILLVGEAGIGKTRLAEELLQWVGRQGIATASARCYAAKDTLAYAPVVAWLRSRPLLPLDKLWLSEIALLLPELLIDHPDLPQQGPLTEYWQRQRLFEALARAILVAQPLLLLIDDLLWCDRDTLEWLNYLLHSHSQAYLLVVGTLRAEEMGAEHPLGALLTALRRSGQLTEIALEPLNEDETKTLATNVAGRELALGLAGQLYRETEGNPLFVVETVRAGLGKGGGEWAGMSLPPTVQAVITARLAQLSPDARGLVSLAATIGREFNFSVLAKASSAGEDTLLRSLDELWQRRIVREHGVDAYDFSHDKIREVAYSAISAARRRLLHRHVAEAVEAVYVGDLDTHSTQLAAHYERAGLPKRAIRYYQRAAEVARRVYASKEAIDHIHKALDLLQGHLQERASTLDESRQDWRLEVTTQLYENLGDLLEMIGQHGEARDAYQGALVKVPQSDPLWQSRLHRKTGNTMKSQAQYEEALQAYAMAETALGREPAQSTMVWWQEWVEIQFDRMWLYYMRDQVREITELAEKVRPIVEQHGTWLQRARFFQCLVAANHIRDRFAVSEETVALSRASLAALQESGDLSEIADAQFKLGFSLLWHGDIDEAEEQMQAALRLVERTGQDLETRCLSYLTTVYRKRGQVKAVRQYALQSLAAGEARKEPRYIGLAKANLAWVAWREGNLSEAEADARAALEFWQPLTRFAFRWTALWPLIGVALVRSEAGGLAQDRISEAIGYARALLQHRQQPLPDALTAIVKEAIQAWDQDQLETARAHLRRAIELAQPMGYL